MKFKIMLPSTTDAALFCAKCSEFPCDIDYVLEDRNCKVDACSLMGVLATGVSTVAEVVINTDEIDLLEQFTEAMKIWKV